MEIVANSKAYTEYISRSISLPKEDIITQKFVVFLKIIFQLRRWNMIVLVSIILNRVVVDSECTYLHIC